jgi:hypothetical protein
MENAPCPRWVPNIDRIHQLAIDSDAILIEIILTGTLQFARLTTHIGALERRLIWPWVGGRAKFVGTPKSSSSTTCQISLNRTQTGRASGLCQAILCVPDANHFELNPA